MNQYNQRLIVKRTGSTLYSIPDVVLQARGRGRDEREENVFAGIGIAGTFIPPPSLSRAPLLSPASCPQPSLSVCVCVCALSSLRHCFLIYDDVVYD
jgi:hypothetical protein